MKNKISLLFYTAFTSFVLSLSCTPARCQITPDATLGNRESSVILPNQTINGTPSSLITGGSSRGSSLFHSFKDFNVDSGRGVFFTNPSGIFNILVRVTGHRLSNIDGTLGVLGHANLFFLNSSGIVFGLNAHLSLAGSFLASTADNIKLSNGNQFSSTNPQAVPLLTINVPIGLVFTTGNPSPIDVEGKGHTLSIAPIAGTPVVGSDSQSLFGLKTYPGNTIALIGGQVNFNGGIVTAPSGRIEISSVMLGSVGINSTPTGIFLDYKGKPSFQDINLEKQALLDASGFVNGDIILQGRKIVLTDGSLAIVSNFGSYPSGKISVNATDTLGINGITDFNLRTFEQTEKLTSSGIVSQAFSTGKGADVVISAKQLITEASGGIGVATFGSGAGGNISIHVEDSSQILGATPLIALGSSIATFADGVGRGGDILLSTKQLSIQDGAQVYAESLAPGHGGNVTISAFDSVRISRNIPVTYAPSSFTPSRLGALTARSGDAGDVIVNTRRLILENGGRLDSTTLTSGAAGSVTVNASDSVDVSGKVPGSLNPTLITSSANAVDPYFYRLLRLSNTISGSSGDITINTGRLSVWDGAQITARNDGSGNAGSVQINTNFINLNNQGGITASTASGQGGNIFLNARNLQLRHNSPITATAGGTRKGGSITISTGTLAALENSNITADALQGQGGKIQITAQGIFRSTDSAITARGKTPDLNGTVQFNTLDVSRNLELAALPAIPVDPTKLIPPGCSANVGPRASKFVVTGSGGLPPSPSDFLGGKTALEDWGTGASSASTLPTSDRADRADIENAIPSTQYEYHGGPLIEAQGWVTNSKGEVVLVANAPTYTPDVPWLKSPSCHAQ